MQNFVKWKSFESRSVIWFQLLWNIFLKDSITTSRFQNRQEFHINDTNRVKLLTQKDHASVYVNDIICIWEYNSKDLNPWSIKPTKWLNTLKRLVDCCQRIVWVGLTIFWGWHLKGEYIFNQFKSSVEIHIETSHFICRPNQSLISPWNLTLR